SLDLVPSREQRLLLARIQVEPEAALAGRERLAWQVDHDFGHDLRADPGEQRVDIGRAQHDRQQAVGERVAGEDRREARRDDRPEAEVAQRPRRVLAARSAAEVLASQQHRSVAIRLAIEYEVRVLPSTRVITIEITRIEVAPVVEQDRAETAGSDR